MKRLGRSTSSQHNKAEDESNYNKASQTAQQGNRKFHIVSLQFPDLMLSVPLATLLEFHCASSSEKLAGGVNPMQLQRFYDRPKNI